MIRSAICHLPKPTPPRTKWQIELPNDLLSELGEQIAGICLLNLPSGAKAKLAVAAAVATTRSSSSESGAAKQGVGDGYVISEPEDELLAESQPLESNRETA
jgi:hypothetical protein